MCLHVSADGLTSSQGKVKDKAFSFTLRVCNLFSPFFNAAVANAAKLMGCSPNELKLVLSTHKVQSGNDSIAKKMTLRQVAF